MSVSGGPNISENGLVLYLDTINPRSFRGEPTTNVVSNPIPTTGWDVANNAGSTATRTFVTENGISFMRISDVAISSGYPRLTDSNFANSATITGTFSTSLEAKGTVGAQLNLRIYENGSTKVTNTVTLTSDWVRYTFENQSTAFALNQPYFNPLTAGATYDIRNIQIESKSYATPFVVGTRGTTVATGGGWADISGNSNHGELTNGPIYNGSNGGSIVFDGVNDLVSINNATSLQITGDITIIYWMYVTAAVSGQGTITKGPSDSDYDYMVYLTSNSTNLSFYKKNSSGTGEAGAGWSGTFINRWVHVAFTLNSTIVTGYENGEFKATNTFTNAGIRSGTNSLLIARGWSSSFPGRLTGIQIYNRALSAQEVLQNFNATRSRFGV